MQLKYFNVVFYSNSNNFSSAENFPRHKNPSMLNITYIAINQECDYTWFNSEQPRKYSTLNLRKPGKGFDNL